MNSEEISVLLVDDDPEDAHLSAIALRSARSPKFRLRHVDSLTAAIEALAVENYDIVLLDLGLRESRGLETLERFRQHNNTIPVVVISGLEDEETALQSLEGKAQDYLFKNDINCRNLSRAVRYAIQRQSHVMEIRRILAQMKEQEEVLQCKNERLRSLYDTAHAFVDNVSHEFRTPLTVVKEYVSLVSDGTLGPISDEQRRFLRIAEDRANDLNTMIDDMLDVSKLEAGMLSVFRKQYRIHEIVDRIVVFLERKAQIKDLALEVKVSKQLPKVYCDAEKVERVLINLAVNAIKFTKPGGKVQISAYSNQADVVLGVSDNGPGIPSDKLDLIFDRFQQAHIDLRNSTKGFGLGLSIAKELTDLNFGRLTVESELGVGSTFWITVPRWNPLEITQRYLDRLGTTNRRCVSLLEATFDDTLTSDAIHDASTFLTYVARATDLALRLSDRQWIIMLPEPAPQAREFIARANAELETTSRNRARGPLPSIEFRITDTWSDLHAERNDILSRVRSFAIHEELLNV